MKGPDIVEPPNLTVAAAGIIFDTQSHTGHFKSGKGHPLSQNYESKFSK